MAAPKGNQFWKIRTKHGRDKLFSSPEVLWNEAVNYFEWCDKTPFDGKVRPYTEAGLCIYLNIDEKTLWNYEKQKDFFQVVRRIKKTIFDQKFVGAAVGNFNANIIARDLGLAEKTENKDEVDLTLNINRNIVTGGAK